MHLSIYSLQQTLFEGNARSVNCTTKGGEITVLDKHEPLIATLASTTITVRDSEEKEHYFSATSGFFEITAANIATILVDEPEHKNSA